MDKYNQILKESKKIDKKYKKNINFEDILINFKVDVSHERYSKLKNYILKSGNLNDFVKNNNCTYLVDNSLKNNIIIKNLKNKIIIKTNEKKVKQINYINKYLLTKKYSKKLVVVGGGLLINVGAYIAQKLKLKLYLFPTTVLSMADSSGGKVRINHTIKNKFYKHYYKSFYEPDLIIIDKSFLSSLPINEKRNGLVEIIKHSLFQSNELYKFLINFNVLKDDKLC